MSGLGENFDWQGPFVLVNYVNETVLNLRTELVNYTKNILEHLVISAFLYAVLCVSLYFCISRWKLVKFDRTIKTSKRVLLVTAHPDDECMFFGPTILRLLQEKETKLYLLCMTTARHLGIGTVRKLELYESCKVLGMDETYITVLDHECINDDITMKWHTEMVATIILRHVVSHDINTLITFDRKGVSMHPNHYSIYYAIAHLSLSQKLPETCRIYVLETVNRLRKYWSFLDIPLSFLLSRTRYMVGTKGRATIQKAMAQHKSQMLWFRKLYLIFSRYVVMNTLQEMTRSDIELDFAVD